jgi:hypothetical protein
MADQQIIPPGEHPDDPYKKDVDPIGFHLYQLQINLQWIEEHRGSFERDRIEDPDAAEAELKYLAQSTKDALRHYLRLSELLLGGYRFDPEKRLPRGLCEAAWVERIRKWLSTQAAE